MANSRTSAQFLLLALVAILFAASPIVDAGDPPRIKGPLYETLSRPNGTSLIKIECRVDTNELATRSGVVVSWYWNDELIHAQWDRFSIIENNGKWVLRIRDLHVDDAGNFTCEATNGFGRAKYTLNLLVSDSSSNKSVVTAATTTTTTVRTTLSTSNVPDVAANGAPRNPNGKPPKFDGIRGSQTSLEVERYVGGSAHLQCKARGTPVPGVLWLRDNQPMRITGTRVGTVKIGRWTLQLNDLQLSDSGRYSCRAYNEFGEIEFTYVLKVHGDEALIPKVTTSQSNVTLFLGENAELPCLVRSEQTPHVQWLKRQGGSGKQGSSSPPLLLEQAQGDNAEQEQSTTGVTDDNDETFAVLSSNAPQLDGQTSDLYFSNLRLDKVSDRDAGTYVCWAKNEYGYSHAELRVRVVTPVGQVAPQEATSESITSFDGRNLLSVYIVVPVLVVVVSLLVAIYYWKNRRRIRAKQTRLRLHYSAAANNSNHGLLLECITSNSSAAANFYNVNAPLSGSGSRLLHSSNQKDYQLSCHAVPSLINGVPVSGSGFNIADTHFALQNNISPSSASQPQDECGGGDSADYTQSSRYTQSSTCTATNNNNNNNVPCAMRQNVMYTPADSEYHSFGAPHGHARSTGQKSSRGSDRRYPRIIIAAPPPTASSCTSSPLSFVSKV